MGKTKKISATADVQLPAFPNSTQLEEDIKNAPLNDPLFEFSKQHTKSKLTESSQLNENVKKFADSYLKLEPMSENLFSMLSKLKECHGKIDALLEKYNLRVSSEEMDQ